MNLTPLALAAAYAALRGNDKDQAPAAPAATPAVTPAPVAQIPPRTDMTQMFGATQDTEDMEAGPAAGQTPSVMTKKNPSFKQAFAEARLAGKPTFTWDGKPGVTFTTKYETETTPAKAKPSVDQSQAETNRLKSQDKFATGVPVSPTVTPTETETKPEAKKAKKNYRGLDGKVHTYEEESEEKPSIRNPKTGRPYAKGGKVKAFAKGGSVSASKRGDGIAQRGKTRGMIVMCGGGKS